MKKLIAVAVLAMMILGTSVSANEWNKIRIVLRVLTLHSVR